MSMVNDTIMKQYLVRFAQVHETFRLPELRALATLEGVDIKILEYAEDTPYCVIEARDDTAAGVLISRSILCDAIYELWGQGPNYESLHTDVRHQTESRWPDYLHASFRFSVHGFQNKRSKSQQIAIIESFKYLGFLGPIKMKNAEHEFCIHEKFEKGASEPSRIFLTRFLAESGRSVVLKYDLKKRHYINTTSMDAELTLVTANMALVKPGSICYDPFNGTGSFPVACAHFGGITMGSDIDGRSIRGAKGRSVASNFAQYGLSSRWLGGFAADLTNTPLRRGRYLDAIVSDPPYGIREGLKVLGMKSGVNPVEAFYKEGIAAHLHPDYVPPKKPYSFEAMLYDVLDFAASTLVDGGRLAFWMPTANDEEVIIPVPSHSHMELLFESIQVFNKWSRRLLTYGRRRDEDVDPTVVITRSFANADVGKKADDLNPFRRKFFQASNEHDGTKGRRKVNETRAEPALDVSLADSSSETASIALQQ